MSARNYHEGKVEAWKKFWEFYGALVSQDEKSNKAKPLYYKNDFVVDLTCSIPLMEDLDCSYIWVEIVEKNPIEPEKKKWLKKMLSKDWLILVCGYGEIFEVYRPQTYFEKKGRKMTAEKTKKVLNELLKQRVILKQKLINQKNGSA
ncbi:MAG: hypothetical protein QW270_06730 [Candidatus Bathyarchaeia archaeon]